MTFPLNLLHSIHKACFCCAVPVFLQNKQNNIIEPENVNVTSSLFIFENSGLLCGFVALTQFLLCVFLTVNTDCCRDFADNFMLLLGCFYLFSGLNNAILLCCLHDAHSQQKQTPHLMDSLSYYCRTQGTQVFKSSFQLCAHLELFFRKSFESCCDRDMIHTHQSYFRGSDSVNRDSICLYLSCVAPFNLQFISHVFNWNT